MKTHEEGQSGALALGTGYASLKDTPNRYVYRDTWGMSAKMALGFISSLRKAYPQLGEELDREQKFFEAALLKHNVASETRGPLAPNAENGQSPRCL